MGQRREGWGNKGSHERGGREDEGGDRTTRLLQSTIHHALSSAPCPSYCMQNHLSRHKETCDSLMHADYCVIKFSQHARCFTSFLPALHFPLLRNKQLKAWDHQYSLHEYSSFPTPVFDACSASTSSTFTMIYKPVQQVNERNDIVTSSTKTTYYQSKLSLIHTSMGTSKRS